MPGTGSEKAEMQCKYVTVLISSGPNAHAFWRRGRDAFVCSVYETGGSTVASSHVFHPLADVCVHGRPDVPARATRLDANAGGGGGGGVGGMQV